MPACATLALLAGAQGAVGAKPLGLVPFLSPTAEGPRPASRARRAPSRAGRFASCARCWLSVRRSFPAWSWYSHTPAFRPSRYLEPTGLEWRGTRQRAGRM
jgi:hypothetical protein